MSKYLTPAQLEDRIAAIMRRVLGARADEVMGALQGDNWQAALDRLYATMQDELIAELGPELKTGVLQSALKLMDTESLALDTSALGRRAETFAKNYTYDLVTGITDTTRERLADAMSTFMADGSQDLQSLGKRVEWLFGGGRGQMIATTEATRASAKGQRILVDELKAESPHAKVTMVWQTSRDEIVCDVCGPLNGTTVKPGDMEPPAHPNCRCALRIVVLDDGGKGV